MEIWGGVSWGGGDVGLDDYWTCLDALGDGTVFFVLLPCHQILICWVSLEFYYYMMQQLEQCMPQH